MVGGLASRFNGYNRTTDDIEIWIEDSKLNRQNLRKSLIELGYGDYPSIETMQFVHGSTSFYASGVELDIMTEIKVIENKSFQKCYEMASISEIEGIKCHLFI